MGKRFFLNVMTILIASILLVSTGCSDSSVDKHAKIDQLAQGLDVKIDDMTSAKGYSAPSMETIKPIVTKQIKQRGTAVTYRIGVAKTNKEKILLEIIEMDSIKGNILLGFGPINLVMKSGNKLYTTDLNADPGSTKKASDHDVNNNMDMSYVSSVANQNRIKEIREAVKSGYIKIRLTDGITKENFDYELSSEEIQMLDKAIQIYDLL